VAGCGPSPEARGRNFFHAPFALGDPVPPNGHQTFVPRPAFPSARQGLARANLKTAERSLCARLQASFSKIAEALADIGTPGAEHAPISPVTVSYSGKRVRAMPRQRRQTLRTRRASLSAMARGQNMMLEARGPPARPAILEINRLRGALVQAAREVFPSQVISQLQD
jgi:hypothetical protein